MAPSGDAYKTYLDFEPTCILEAGVGPMDECRTTEYWDQGVECWLFEPLPRFYAPLAQATQDMDNVHLFKVALWDFDGTVKFHNFAQGSYVQGVPPRNNKRRNRRSGKLTKVPAATLSRYDTGRFDLALIDVEASEWMVLKHMVSRPRLISLEMWKPSSPAYCHQHYDEIMTWMLDNGYKQVGTVHRDSYFKREDP